MSIPIERFATVPLFEGLSREEISRLLGLGRDVRVEKGAEVVEQGQPGDGFYIIAAGAFEVVARGRASDECLARLEELSHFGEMSLVADEPRTASVVCVEPGRLKKIPKEPFRELLERDDPAAYRVVLNMSRVLAQRLSRLTDRFVG